MKRGLTICSMLLVASLSLTAQRGAGGPVPESTHSNAPAGSRAASSDRDKGTDRAADEGKVKGKHKGSKKHHQSKKA